MRQRLMRGLNHIWDWWNSWAPWTYDSSRPPLATAEHVVRDAPAVQVRGWISIKGRLILTSRRLYFRPYRSPVNPSTSKRLWPDVEIRLEEIEHLDIIDWGSSRWGTYPAFPRFRIHTESPMEFTFVVARYRDWKQQTEWLLTQVNRTYRR